MMNESPDAKPLVDVYGNTLSKQKISWFQRIPWTKSIAWATAFWVFIVNGDNGLSVLSRWINGSGKLTVVNFDHVSHARSKPLSFDVPESAESPTENDPSGTDSIELDLQLVNHSKQAVIIDRVEFDFEANGVVAKGIHQTVRIEVSGEYRLIIPELKPNEKATRYIKVPHILKPDDADRLIITLEMPHQISIDGTYKIRTRIVSTAGTIELDSFEVPIESNLKQVHNMPDTTVPGIEFEPSIED